jgi:uncharacterized membrane protein
MENRIKVLGHPVHPMLVVFPLGLLATAVIFDILYMINENPAFATTAYWMIAAGVIGGLLAAVFGLADWLTLPRGTRAQTLGLIHGIGNVIVTGLFAVSWFQRSNLTGNIPDGTARVFSFAGVLLALFTAWLGGEMVYRLGVSVDQGANLNAPSSLSGQPASTSVGQQSSRVQIFQRGIPVTGQPDEPPDEDQP